METIGDKIKARREQLGWTQAKLADSLNIKIGTLSGYERNYRQPDARMLQLLAKTLGISSDYLLGIDATETHSQRAEEVNSEEQNFIRRLINFIKSEEGTTAESITMFIPLLTAFQQQVGGVNSNSSKSIIRLPILGAIRAGVPLLVQESYEGYLEVPESLRADFALQVTGDSMIGAGILDGDYTICRQVQDANSGQVVVALKDQVTGFSEATLKFYVNNGNGPTLRAANPNYPEYDMKDGYRIAGVAVGLIRKNMPGIQTFREYMTVAGHEDWTDVIEMAVSAGMKINQIKEILAAQIDIAKRLRGG